MHREEGQRLVARVERVKPCPARAGWLEVSIVTQSGQSMQWCFAGTTDEQPHVSIGQALAAWTHGEILIGQDLAGAGLPTVSAGATSPRTVP